MSNLPMDNGMMGPDFPSYLGEFSYGDRSLVRLDAYIYESTVILWI